jgi:hypothetical protein
MIGNGDGRLVAATGQIVAAADISPPDAHAAIDMPMT